MKIMTAGVVILNYNDFPTTLELVKKIHSFRELDSIVVIDNNSSDDSFSRLYAVKDSLGFTLIRAERNGGYSYGNNLGIKYLQTTSNPDVIIIANPDVIFTEEIVKRIKDVFVQTPSVGLLSPIMLGPDGEPLRMWLKLPTYLNSLLDCSLVGRQINKLLGHRSVDYSSPLMEVEKIPGSFMAFRTDVLRKIDLFDEGVFLYYEENIIGSKMKNAGYKTALITNLTYIHNHSVTIKKNLSILNGYRANLSSKMYYEKEYRRIGRVRENLLTLFMKYGIVEKRMLLLIKNLLK